MSEEIVKEESMADFEEQLDQAAPWNRVRSYLENGTHLTVKVQGIVKGGVVANVEEIRAFIPASQLALHYVENLEDYLLQDIEVQVLEADEEENRLILSARNILREKAAEEKAARINSIAVGTVITGEVESLQSYGAFVRFDGNLSGLVHISQISQKRIKTPNEVLNVGDEVKAKVIAVKDGKISLSIKALEDPAAEEEPEEKVVIPKAEDIGTSLGDLFKNIKL
jgi:small subunit ribosomal protein S1